MRVFIDTLTGTWGNAEDIVFLNENDSGIFIETSDDMSDKAIIAVGNYYGDAPILSLGM